MVSTHWYIQVHRTLCVGQQVVGCLGKNNQVSLYQKLALERVHYVKNTHNTDSNQAIYSTLQTR